MNHAKYTVVLKNLLDTPETKALIDKALSTYPLYEKKSQELYIPSVVPTRSELNQKLLNHYKYREIGFETVGRFIDELEIAMNEIMPRYNQLLFSVDQDYNILYNADYTRKIEREKKNSDARDITGNETSKETDENTNNTTNESSQNVDSSDSSTTSSNMSNNSKNVHSATPQSQLTIGTKDINSVDYADNASWNQDIGSNSGSSSGTSSVDTTGNSKSTTTNNGERNRTGNTTVKNTGSQDETEDSLETVQGNYGAVSTQYLVNKYRETIINVEQMIINDKRIKELFMMIW